jgi:hypothetical protein
MRWPPRWTPALLWLLAVPGCDPQLTTINRLDVMFVAQTITVRVTEGGESAALDESSVQLIDALGQTFSPASTVPTLRLDVTRTTPTELSLVVPPGAAPGAGRLEVKTLKGPAFSSSVTINRQAAVRDMAGKVWILRLEDAETTNQYREIRPTAPANLGTGFGRLSIGSTGRTLASSGRGASNNQVKLAWLGPQPLVLGSVASFLDPVRDVAVTSLDQTLVAYARGTATIAKVNTPSDTLTVSSPLGTGATLAVAAARLSPRAAALGQVTTPSPAYVVSQLDLSIGGNSIAGRQTLPWPISGNPNPVLLLAISPGGGNILVLDGENNRGMLIRRGQAPRAFTFPNELRGPRALSASSGDELFYAACGGIKPPRLAVLRVQTAGIKFEAPITLPFTDASGPIRDVDSSAIDEILVLAQRDLVRVSLATGKAQLLALPNLFKDKVKGEEGAAVALQP